MNNKIVGAIIGIIILILIGVIAFSDSNGGDSNGEAQTAPSSNNKIGNAEAEVVLMEAYSLGCPACAQFHPILKQIREEYSDRITFQVVHFPLTANFQNARAGHRAVEAAALQGKFWEMHDLLFEKRDLWTKQATNNPVPQIETFAAELGLDVEKFKIDFKSEAVNDIINGDEEYLKSLGASVTPTFFINGEKIESKLLSTVEAARQTLDRVLDTKKGAPTSPASNNKIGESEKGITLIEAYSFSCPACAEFHPLLEQIHEEYDDEIVFQVVHYPLSDNFKNARAGHQAVEAAALQGKFWEMNDLLFEKRDLWTQQATNNPVPQIETFAEELGLDIEKFQADFESAEVSNIIDEDEEYLANLGVNSTPTFFINGEKVENSQLGTIEAARQTLDKILDPEEDESSAQAETQ